MLDGKKRSRIEKKILSAKFSAHSNDISVIRDFRSETGRSDSMEKMNSFLNASVINIKSVRILDLSGDEKRSVSEYSLQNLIQNVSKGATVVLPGYSIQIRSLDLEESVVLKGVSGSKLKLLNGSINIGSETSEPINVELREICVEYMVRKQLSSMGKFASMISIRPGQVHLEIHDCYFSKSNRVDENGLQQVNCIGIEPFLNEVEIPELFDQVLNVHNCFITGFDSAIKGGLNYCITLERLHITLCKSDGVALKYPNYVKIENSCIEKCGGNGILIKVKGDTTKTTSPRSSYNSRGSIYNPSGPMYIFNGNTIKSNSKSGVEVSCNDLSRLHYNIQIKENVIEDNLREGIALKHLLVSELLISDNKLLENEGSGVWMQKVTSFESGSFIVRNNEIFDSTNGFGLYMYSTVGEIIENTIVRNYLGGVMIVGNHEKGVKSMLLKGNKICNNRENGITVQDFIEGSLDIENCVVNENSRNGLLASVSRKSFVKMTTFKNKIVSNLRGMAVIKNSEIKRNGGYGIIITLTYCLVQKTVFADNVLGDTFSIERDGGNIMFNDLERVEAKKCLNCNPVKCQVF